MQIYYNAFGNSCQIKFDKEFFIMSKQQVELEDVGVHLEESLNLLKCFIDFCDNEGFIGERETEEKEKIGAVCFVRRLQQYKSLLIAATDSLETSSKDIGNIIEATLLEKKGSVA